MKFFIFYLTLIVACVYYVGDLIEQPQPKYSLSAFCDRVDGCSTKSDI